MAVTGFSGSALRGAWSPRGSPSSSSLRKGRRRTLVRLSLFERAKAYAARFAFLDVLHVPRGFVDFENDLPRRDVQLLATTGNLLMRKDTHPERTRLSRTG